MDHLAAAAASPRDLFGRARDAQEEGDPGPEAIRCLSAYHVVRWVVTAGADVSGLLGHTIGGAEVSERGTPNHSLSGAVSRRAPYCGPFTRAR